MDFPESHRAPGLALRWVEVTDDRGRACLEMRWSTASAESAAPSSATPATTPSATPPIAPHAA